MLLKKIFLKILEIFLNLKKFIYLQSSKSLSRVFQIIYFPRYSKRLENILVKNRESLNSIENLVDNESYYDSQDSYGLPNRILKHINKPLNNYPTYTDLFCLCSESLNKNISYVEIGVSVMKNTYQVANYLNNATIFCFDINKINPAVENKLERISSKDNLSHYKLLSNELFYFKGDVFNPQDLNNFKDLVSSANIIFSDAHHSYEGVKSEYLNLITEIVKDEYYLFYDDLNKGILKAFKEIAYDLHKRDSTVNAYSFYLNGWIGKNEKMHKVGLITNSLAFEETVTKNSFPLLFKKQYI